MAARHRQLGLMNPKHLGDGLDLLANLLQDKNFGGMTHVEGSRLS